MFYIDLQKHKISEQLSTNCIFVKTFETFKDAQEFLLKIIEEEINIKNKELRFLLDKEYELKQELGY